MDLGMIEKKDACYMHWGDDQVHNRQSKTPAEEQNASYRAGSEEQILSRGRENPGETLQTPKGLL